MLKKMLFTILAFTAVAVLFVGCGNSSKEEASDQASVTTPDGVGAQTLLEKIKAAGKIVVYTNPNFPPYEYLGKDGIDGAEIELVKIIAEKIGVKAELVSSEFDSILMSVAMGKADLGASGFTIKEERKKKVDFSIPFVRSTQYLIIPETSPIKTVEDLAGKVIGAQQGTTGALMIEDEVLKGILKGTKATIRNYNTAPDTVVALNHGKVDAVVIDDLVAKSLAKANPGLIAIELVKKDGNTLAEVEEFGMILAKGNEDLLAIINDVIKTAKEDGSLDELIEKHKVASAKKEN